MNLQEGLYVRTTNYLVDVKDLKIKSILTSEQFYIEKYKVGE